MEYPNKQEVQERAASGEPVSQDEASSLVREEGDMTGWGPVPGGTAGTHLRPGPPRRPIEEGSLTSDAVQRQRRACTTGSSTSSPRPARSRASPRRRSRKKTPRTCRRKRYASCTKKTTRAYANCGVVQARALGGAPPSRGSASSYVQSIADQNERDRRTIYSEDPVMTSPSGHRRSM